MKKRILCFGDSNTWGYDAKTNGRFSEEVRWPRRMQELLGDDYEVIEEGLCGRTTVFEDPLNEGLCGLTYLTPCMMTHSPLDYMVVMLGTNDCKERFAATAHNIGDGMKRLVRKAQVTDAWRTEPGILIVAPGRIEKGCETSFVGGEMGICSEKSAELAEEYRACADLLGCDFLDADPIVSMNTIDYMHLDEKSHASLAEELASIIKGRG